MLTLGFDFQCDNTLCNRLAFTCFSLLFIFLSVRGKIFFSLAYYLRVFLLLFTGEEIVFILFLGFGRLLRGDSDRFRPISGVRFGWITGKGREFRLERVDVFIPAIGMWVFGNLWRLL